MEQEKRVQITVSDAAAKYIDDRGGVVMVHFIPPLG